MNPAIATVSRNERRFLLASEARRRRSGDWGLWEHIPIPFGTPLTTGWAAEFRTAHRNGVFCVLERKLPSGVRHLMISSLSGERPTWPEAQRIKDELARPEATAVEVYPPRAEIVDQADAYHLWVLTERLPFGLD